MWLELMQVVCSMVSFQNARDAGNQVEDAIFGKSYSTMPYVPLTLWRNSTPQQVFKGRRINGLSPSLLIRLGSSVGRAAG